MKHPIVFVVIASGILVASCQCGINAEQCSTTADCQTNETCINGGCRSTTGDGGTGSQSGHSGPGPCIGLQCQQVSCSGGATTTLTGKVFTPAGDLALYNAIVYVPNGAVQPFPAGVTCDRCGAITSGSPVVATLTGPDGTFRLENVPAGQNIPLVIQMGKWRRQITIPTVTACQESSVSAATTRLPRNTSEGDIPKMAIATGEFDPFECLLRKVGIDDAEITAPSGTGRVHFFRAHKGKDLSSPVPRSDQLWGSLDTLKQYDIVMLPCEGTVSTFEVPKTLDGQQNVIDYANAGGRLFLTHFSYTWMTMSETPFRSVANWNLAATDPVTPFAAPFDVTVDTSFPKGDAFAEWLLNVQASTTKGVLTLHETRHNLDSVISPAAQRWLYGYNPRQNAPIVPHFTFNTPVSHLAPEVAAASQCGRVVFSSFHVTAGALGDGGTTFPSICRNDPPTAQEKALIFMLFDLSSCVQHDEVEPDIW